MFGAPTAYFFEYLLGIKQDKEHAGYESITIEPMAVWRFGYMKGNMTVPTGEIAVAYERLADSVRFEITIPKGVRAKFKYLKQKLQLKEGKNLFNI